MSQRSEIYRDFREKLKSVGELAGQQSTNDLLKGVDQLWRVLMRVRSAMVKTLILQNKIQNQNEAPIDDFSTLFLQIHNPKKEGRLCEHCCGLVEFGISECPYCGEKVNGHNSPSFISSISIDIKPNPKAPNWNIDYSKDSVLAEARRKQIEALPTIQPRGSTAEAFGGPSGVPASRHHSGEKRLSRSACDLIAWARRRELLQRVPYTAEQLTRLSYQELKNIALGIKARTYPELRVMKAPEVIRVIMGHQPNHPVDAGPPPVGDLPEFKDIDYVDT